MKDHATFLCDQLLITSTLSRLFNKFRRFTFLKTFLSINGTKTLYHFLSNIRNVLERIKQNCVHPFITILHRHDLEPKLEAME